MKNITKKIISLALAALLAVGMMLVPVFAEGEDEPDGTEQFLANLYGLAGVNATTALQKDSLGTNSAVGLKPADATSPVDAYFEYYLDAPANLEKLVLTVSYAASGDRHMDVSIDGEQLQNVTCPDTTGWEIFNEVDVTFENISKGSHTLRFAAPADFNNDTIKTPNIVGFVAKFYLAAGETMPVVTEAEPQGTTAPKDEGTEKAPEGTNANDPDGTKAPTNDSSSSDEGGCGSVLGVSAVVLTVTSVFGCAITRRRGR